ncbi:hypothetical protein [Aliikangiella sp. G2MR2-5]|uniref:hypothetical protein n=1 Tax=Aliikangiella sp. G2MR2-5 TaxID=2788943 RepID=UPI0018AA407A|nr:hypothetical protein [Aliikangiella sp. G2MR2-5]
MQRLTNCCAFNSLAKLRYNYRLGLAKNNQHFTPCALSLTPWELSERAFERAKNTAQALSRLLEKISQNSLFLSRTLSDFNDTSSLLFAFKKMHSKVDVTETVATGVNLSRFDFLLDNNNQWRLVESNTIAAGMGPFSEKLSDLLVASGHIGARKIIKNNAICTQSRLLFQEAKKYSRDANPNIVFVVEANEDNRFDQAYLSNALKALGANVYYRTLKSIANKSISSDGRLYLKEGTGIDLIYFRTGYNLADYNIDNEQSGVLIEARNWIEQHHLAVCPSIAHQMASSKWIQLNLSEMNAQQLSTQFGLNRLDSEFARTALATQHKKIESNEQVQSLLKNGDWILKSQLEGGGTLLDSLEQPQAQKINLNSYFLMQKIHTQPRKLANVLKEDTVDNITNVTSELGIFMLGNQHNFGGYLVRSKPSTQLETGVHRGGGFLDSLVFK